MLTSGLPEGLVSFLRGVRPDLRTWKAPWPACMLVWGARGISGRAERALLLPAPLRGLSVSLQCALLSEGGSVPDVLQRVCEPAATERSCNRKAEVKQRVKMMKSVAAAAVCAFPALYFALWVFSWFFRTLSSAIAPCSVLAHLSTNQNSAGSNVISFQRRAVRVLEIIECLY